MPIEIPKKMKTLLQKDSNYTSKVFRLIDQVEPLVHTPPDFFPHYTFHGDSHINAVLELAEKLIPKDTLSALSGKDMAYLISAIILHDLGMFLTIDGFNKLLSGEWKDHRMDKLDQATFEKSWEEYLARVSRYSDEKMRYSFGNRVDVKALHLNRDEMVEMDKLIIGDFLRQQHPRLAHEIAETKFMGSTDNDIFGKAGFDADDRRIIGLIARSHGMPMRDTENYIARFYTRRTIAMPCGTPIFYLMAIVRIADLLDAGQHRAPKALTDRQSIEVPISLREWRWNGLIKIEHFQWMTDTKNLHIQATPESSTDFTLVEKWLKWVQQELDMSWSVIAEMYPNQPYQLSIHRVKSNILEPETIDVFREDFLPKEAKLTANPDLLKLLIHPLYGDDPSYGVRELLQNALDACRERADKEEGEYHGKVTVSLDTTAKTLTVTDNGIGMNEDVILNYFLAAGSSYRHSDDWIKNYTTDKKSKVARTGKFGVGVLAAFLLGKTVRVQTRRWKEERGYEFEVQLNDTALDIRRVDCKVGTTITVELSDAVLDMLNVQLERDGDEYWYRWYVFQEPEVEYVVDGSPLSPDECETGSVPQTQDDPGEWFVLNSTEYDAYLWRPTPYTVGDNFCNGIRINGRHPFLYHNTGIFFQPPCFSVVDTQNNLNLDLSRKKVLDYPDKECLFPELFKYGLASLLTVSLIDLQSNYISPFGNATAWCKRGYTLLSPDFLRKARPEHIFLAVQRFDVTMTADIPTTDAVLVFTNPIDKSRSLRTLGIVTAVKVNIYGNADWRSGPYNGSLLEEIERSFPITPVPVFPLSDLSSHNLSVLGAEAVVELTMQYDDTQPQGPLIDIIHEYLGNDVWIPYDLEERKKKFPKAFQELKPYMDHITKYGRP